MTVKPTTQGWPQAGDLAVETALPVTGNVSRTDGQTVLTSMDTLFGGILEDRSAQFVGGGTISLNSAGTTLTFSDRLDFIYNNAGTQQTITGIVAAAGTLGFTSSGNVAYITLTKGSPGSAALTSNATSLPAATTSQEVFLIAIRRDDLSPSNPRVYLSTGLSVSAGKALPAANTTDANGNESANSFISGYTTTPTAGGTTTLTVASAQQQYFTGTLNQTVVLPVTSTMVLGQSFQIVNNSTGVVTVQSSGDNTILTQSPNSSVIYTVVSTSLTTAAAWNPEAGGGGLVTSYQSTTFTAASGYNYLVNTTSAAFTATLPTGTAGATIQLVDDSGTWGTHNLTIAPATGQSIQGISGTGAAGALVANLSGAFVQLSWDSTNSYWTVTTNGFTNGASGSLATAYQSTSFSAVAGNNYQVNTSAGAVTATLPVGATGVTIQFIDDASTFATNNLTIAPSSGQTIQGISGNGSLVMNLNGSFAQLSWDSTNSYWTVTSTGFQYGPTYSPGVTGGILPSTGLPGATAGTAIATGYVGETVTGAISSSTTATTSYANITSSSITLGAGVWLVYYSICVQLSIGASPGSPGFTQLTGATCLNNGSSTVSGSERAAFLQSSVTTTSGSAIGSVNTAIVPIVLSSPTTYTVQVKYSVGGGSVATSVTAVNSAPQSSTFYAVRIA